MRKNIILLLLCLAFYFCKAQSVSINTDGSAPAADNMLEIKKAGKSKVAIKSNSFNDTAELQFSNRSPGNFGTDLNLRFIREQGLYIGTTSDISSRVNDSLFTMLRFGNIGIGTKIPAAKLDVIGNLKITDGTQGAGKVLTSNASGLASWQDPGNPEAFSAIGTAPAISNFQLIATGVQTKVTVVNVEERDDGNIFDPAITRATISSEGWYHLDVSLNYSLAEAGVYNVTVNKFSAAGASLGPVRYVHHEIAPGLSDQDFQIGISCNAYFFAGEYLEVYTTQNSGVQQRIAGSFFSWFNMHKIK